MASYLPVGLLIGVVLLVQLGFAFGAWETSEIALAQRGAITPPVAEMENTAALGMLIYTKYVFLFQAAGLVLLVAMIGAIVLTLRKRKDVKRQNVLTQMYRDPAAAVELKDIKPGQGL
jgi:NADH-quinone oxidoreductase subunit J